MPLATEILAQGLDAWLRNLKTTAEARTPSQEPGGDDGVGAVRAFRTGRSVTGERLTEKVERRLLAYEDAFNASMRNYRARIELHQGMAEGLARYAEERAPRGT
ncbi:hypothetical protein [Nonomuraea sp. NPDC050691]|uniref:hypothetical protein n=1 Tax=Nonomuraea sp. NPDC050691 TaxID=3155661 RepID=UPI0033FB8DC9